MQTNKYSKYCTGCGLCKAVGFSELHRDKKGFFHPQKEDELNKICPASGIQCSLLDKNNIWGRNKGVYLGWTNDKELRDKASSGGIISQVACYLLENKYVDYVIQIGANKKNQTETELYFSKTIEEVKSHCGSRYSISSPLIDIDKIDCSKKYAFIGKPCDVTALHNYLECTPQLRESIRYVLSFFCMGVPSEQAQEKLLHELGCNECDSLTYRGNGWPGFTTAVDKNGKRYQMDYNSSWGKILGRDLMTACKYCIDGIGELADISCGDAWYLTDNNKPDFSEHEGRNVIFARTTIGQELLMKMKEKGQITIHEYDNYQEELPLIQTSQFNRRRDMLPRIMAMKVMLRPVPDYPVELLKSYSSGVKFKHKLKTFMGSCKRILKGGM